MSITERRGTAYFARMRSLCMLLTIGLGPIEFGGFG